MVSLMQRRREMMLVPSGSTLMYRLKNRTVTDSEIIYTGVFPLSYTTGMTILYDIDITTNPTGTSGAYRYTLIRITGETYGINFCKYYANDTYLALRFAQSATYTKFTSVAGRKRLVITREPNATSITVIGKNGTSTPTTQTLTATRTITTTGEMMLGRTGGAGYGMPPSIINLIEVHNVVLPQSAIDAFLAD